MSIDELIEQKTVERDNLLNDWGQIFIDDLIKKAHILKNELIKMGIL